MFLTCCAKIVVSYRSINKCAECADSSFMRAISSLFIKKTLFYASFLCVASVQLSFAAIPLETQKEIQETQQKIDELQKKDKSEEVQVVEELEFLKKYLNSLTVINQLENQACTSPQSNLSDRIPFVEQKFLQALKKIDRTYKSDIYPSEVYKLIHYIESNKEAWRAGTSKPAPLELRDKQGKATPVKFELDEKGKIYLEFASGKLGEGATKVAHQVTSYGSWTRLARLTLKPYEDDPSQKVKQFLNEQKFLGMISALPLEEQTGLVETYHVGKDRIIQTMYPQDLLAAMHKTREIQKMTLDQRLDLVHQLSLGIKKLHELGINHADLKEENILVGLMGKKPKLAVSDFDLAYLPQEMIKNGELRERSGTIRMMAPEVLKIKPFSHPTNIRWYGSDDHEKLENALKSDTYAAGLIAYQMIKPEKRDWILKCNQGRISGYGEFQRFLNCQVPLLEQFIREESEKSVLDPVDHLIAAAINPDPVQRINSKQFEEGIKYIQERFRNPSLRHSALTSQELITQYQQTRYADYVKITQAEANTLLLNGSRRPGIYVVHPVKDTHNGYLMGITFIDRSGSIRTKMIIVDPKQPVEVEREIEFLKKIGTLRTPLSFI